LKVQDIIKRYSSLFNAAKYGIATAIGFLVTEVVLTSSVFAEYHSINVPSSDFSSLFLLELNALAFAIGVTVAFFLNQNIMIEKDRRGSKGVTNTIVKLLKFQLVSLAGNVITILVQLILLATFSIPPTFGTIVGAIIAFPASYFLSLRFVWKIFGKPNLEKSEASANQTKDTT
jgi:putative flippase GtrA